MPHNLPTDLLRTFVAIAETGSMIRASEKVLRTQSALSVQMRKLEELTQTTLFYRDGRRLKFTPAGEALLSYARQILSLNDKILQILREEPPVDKVRIGMVEDFADSGLSELLAKLPHSEPEMKVQVQIGTSTDLRARIVEGELDIAVCLGKANDPTAVAVVDLVWLGDPSLLTGELPLGLIQQPCICSQAAVAALNEAGIDYRVVLETSSYSVLMAAVNAGIAITCRPVAFLKEPNNRLLIASTRRTQISYTVHTRSDLPANMEWIVSIMRLAVSKRRSAFDYPAVMRLSDRERKALRH